MLRTVEVKRYVKSEMIEKLTICKINQQITITDDGNGHIKFWNFRKHNLYIVAVKWLNYTIKIVAIVGYTNEY